MPKFSPKTFCKLSDDEEGRVRSIAQPLSRYRVSCAAPAPLGRGLARGTHAEIVNSQHRLLLLRSTSSYMSLLLLLDLPGALVGETLELLLLSCLLAQEVGQDAERRRVELKLGRGRTGG